jgi:diguanylate cyclase (GGDEF)-like protein
MSRRLWPVSLASGVMLFAAGAVTILTFGWHWLVPGAIAAVAFIYLTRRLSTFRHPELALAAHWLAAELLLGVGIALASGPREYLLVVLVIVAVGLGFDWGAVSNTPPVLWVPLLSAIVLTMTGSAVGNLDAESCSTAIVDQLTGAFNRLALIPRAAEIAHQAAATGSPVAVIVCDVDSFKTINDQLGHSAGDTVLKEVSGRLRSCMGAFEPIYRFGGEEFVLLLAGLDLAPAVEVAAYRPHATAPIQPASHSVIRA